MRKYHVVMTAVLFAALLSACSGKSDKPATEKSKENAQETVQSETRMPDIQILDEPETTASQETSVAAETLPAGAADAGQTGAGSAGDGSLGAGMAVQPAAGAESQAAVKETEPEKVYSVEAFESTMYATAGVNVRASYSTQSDVVTSLSPGQKVKVTGRSANGWMRIIYNGQEVFVYEKYLSDSAPKESTSGPVPTENKTPGTSQTESLSPGSVVAPGGSPDTSFMTPGNVTIVEPLPGSTSSSGAGGTSPGQGPGPGSGTSGGPTGSSGSASPVGGPGM